jgi:PKD repeat protein
LGPGDKPGLFLFHGPKKEFEVVMKIARRLLLLALIIFAIVNCDQVDFQAPTGATLAISVQPQTVANNGNANITVVGTRGNGAPLPDETLIQFTTDLGSITPNPAKTDNGIATATFRAGVRSGTATITATSGAAEAVSVEVVIGEARPAQVVLITTPSTLPFGGGTVRLTAHVTDEDGNPLGGVAVFFETTAGELNSGGRAVRTNDAGVATDTLTTTTDAEVTVTTANGVSDDSQPIDVSPGEGPECSFVFSPPDPEPGETVIFTSTSTNPDAPITQFLWDFGDGDTDEGPVVEHVFEVAGTYTVVLTVIDQFGFSSVCTEEVVVQTDLPFCSFEAIPDPAQEGESVLFDASDSDDESGIALFEWSFGDGATATTTTPIVNHTYSLPGCGGGADQTVPVSLIVTDNEGSTSFCSIELTIECQ